MPWPARRAAWCSGIISVYRALGGGWQIREGHDVISDEVKAEMARRTDWGRMLEPSHHLPKLRRRKIPERTAENNKIFKIQAMKPFCVAASRECAAFLAQSNGWRRSAEPPLRWLEKIL